jgi:DNA-binding HxlR family transcriptional regulator
MSHAATNWAITQRGLKPAAKLVLWYLCDRHNPDYGCFPSQEQLADDAEMSRSSLNTHLADLESAGLIRREKRHSEDGHKRLSTRYFLAFEKDFKPQSHVQNLDMEGESHVQIQAESHVQNLDSNTVREEPVKEEEDARERAVFSDLDWEQLLAVAGYPPSATVTRWWEEGSAARHVNGWLEKYGFTPAEVIRVAQEARKGHDAPLQGPKGLDAAMARAGALKAAGEAAGGAPADLTGQRLDRLRRIAGWVNSGSFVPQTMINNIDRRELVSLGLCTDEKLKERGFY